MMLEWRIALLKGPTFVLQGPTRAWQFSKRDRWSDEDYTPDYKERLVGKRDIAGRLCVVFACTDKKVRAQRLKDTIDQDVVLRALGLLG